MELLVMRKLQIIVIQFLKKILHTMYLEIQIALKTLSFKKYLGKGVEILNIKVPLVVINDNLF